MTNIIPDNDINLWDFHQTTLKDNFKVGHPRQDYLKGLIIRQFNSGKLLEIGFGDTYLLNSLSNKYKTYGADISTKNIELHKKELPKITFSLINTSGKLPYKDNFFDIFVASEVLEHMSDKELTKTIKEIHRILKTGGKAYLTFPYNENLQLNQFYCPHCNKVSHPYGHKQCWNDKKVEDVFAIFNKLNYSTFFTRYIGNTKLENFAGFTMYHIRNLINRFNRLPNSTYLVICTK